MTEEFKKQGEPKASTKISDSELERAVSLLAETRPELADPDKHRILKKALNEQINKLSSGPAENERRRAETITTLATSLSGGVALALLAATIVPSLPAFSIAGAVLGLLGSKFAANKIDQLADKDD